MVDLFGGTSNDMLSSLHHTFSLRKWELLKHLWLLKDFPQLPLPQAFIYSQCVFSNYGMSGDLRMANGKNPTEWEWEQENN